MILVTGSVKAREGSFNELLELSREHVQRSRQEPGCLSHAVHVDVEDDLRLVFVERWQDRAALKAHFLLQSSRDFVAALEGLVQEPPSLSIYRADELEPGDL